MLSRTRLESKDSSKNLLPRRDQEVSPIAYLSPRDWSRRGQSVIELIEWEHSGRLGLQET